MLSHSNLSNTTDTLIPCQAFEVRPVNPNLSSAERLQAALIIFSFNHHQLSRIFELFNLEEIKKNDLIRDGHHHLAELIRINPSSKDEYLRHALLLNYLDKKLLGNVQPIIASPNFWMNETSLIQMTYCQAQQYYTLQSLVANAIQDIENLEQVIDAIRNLLVQASVQQWRVFVASNNSQIVSANGSTSSFFAAAPAARPAPLAGKRKHPELTVDVDLAHQNVKRRPAR